MQKFTKQFIVSASILYLSSSMALADTVTQLKGKAYISNISDVKPVTLHQALKHGDQITTGQSSHVTILLNEKCRIDIPPLHFVRIKDLKSCPVATPIKGTAAVKNAASTGVKIAGTTAKGSSVLPLLLFGGAAIAVIVHDNRKSSPD